MCVAAMAWLAAPNLVALVFERGRFDAADTEVVSSLLRYGVVQMPPFFAAIVLVQYLAARRRHRLIAAAAILNVAVKLLANVLFVERLGPAGVLLGSAAMYATSAFVLGMAVMFTPATDDE
jgi:peptidoglycan biosynthesis protein MviN/MurJ (putative lipid II flippase)